MQRRSNEWMRWALPVGMVAFALLGAGLVYLAVERMGEEPAAYAGPPPPGMTAVPILARPLPAFTQLELSHLVDPNSGVLGAVHIPTESLLESTITSPQALLGRVLAVDKRAGQVISEAELMPEGTRPGLVAGIPPGKRAVRLEATRVSGLLGLRRGDRFDLMASGGTRSAPGQAARTRSRSIVQNGMIVQPVQARRSVADGKIIEEVVIAVDPYEVAALTTALESGQRIDTLPRSGRSGASAYERDDVDRSHEEVAEIDLIRGTSRTFQNTPGGPRPPAVGSGPAY